MWEGLIGWYERVDGGISKRVKSVETREIEVVGTLLKSMYVQSVPILAHQARFTVYLQMRK